MNQQTQWNIRKVLRWTEEDFRKKGISSPRLDAEILISKALEISRVELYLDLDRPLLKQELAYIHQLVARRRNREPIAYILKEKEFFAIPFIVNQHVLIPRPETEILVERVLECFQDDSSTPLHGLDVCTGSGAIGLTLARRMKNVNMDLSDVSKDALDVAQLNCQVLGLVDRIRFFYGSLFDARREKTGEHFKEEQYDFITANPPYISNTALLNLQPEIKEFEPQIALQAGEDGLDVIRQIISNAHRYLKPRGKIWLEIGSDQKEASELLLASTGKWADVKIIDDYSKFPRIVYARKA